MLRLCCVDIISDKRQRNTKQIFLRLCEFSMLNLEVFISKNIDFSKRKRKVFQ